MSICLFIRLCFIFFFQPSKCIRLMLSFLRIANIHIYMLWHDIRPKNVFVEYEKKLKNVYVKNYKEISHFLSIFPYCEWIIGINPNVLYTKRCRILLWIKCHQLDVSMTFLCWTRIFFPEILILGENTMMLFKNTSCMSI